MRLQEIRRAIVRPMTEVAMEMLREGRLPEEGVEVCSISEAAYQKHFQLFNDLHRVCGIAENDFEVEEIEPERLPLVMTTLKTYPRRDASGRLDVPLDELLDGLYGICWRGREMGVFLVT